MPDLDRMRAAAAELSARLTSSRTHRFASMSPRGALSPERIAWRIEPRAAAAAEPSSATIYLHGIVGSEWDGLKSGSFAQALDGLDVDRLSVRVNSPGGFVADGVAIYSALLEHRAHKTVRVDGLAASAASMIAMAGDEIEISKPARMMIHDAWGIAIGNAGDLLKEAEILDGLSQDIAQVYADRAGGKPETWRGAMLAETWYSSAEAVTAKLADRVVNDPAAKTGPEDRASQLIWARARARNIVKR